MAENNTPNNSELRESRSILNDILNFLKQEEAVRNNITKSQTDANNLQKQLNKLYQQTIEASGDIVDDLNATETVEKRILSTKRQQKVILEKIEETVGKTSEAYANAKGEVTLLNKKLDTQLKTAERLDRAGGGFQFLSNLADDIPGIRKLGLNFDKAAVSARRVASEQKKGAGFSGMLKSNAAGFKTLLSGKLGAVGLVATLVKLFTAADARAVKLARNLGISKQNARGLADEFVRVQRTSSNLFVNADTLGESIGQLSDALGATVINSAKTLENQVFLTKNLGLSAENASKLSILGDSFNQSATGATNEILGLNEELAKTNGFLIPANKLLGDIANLSAEIQGYFGFSTKELQAAVYQTRRFGISLDTANSIAGSLLDFETSIRNELQLELLTNRSLNFERARSLAFTGDIAGASAEVLKQTQMLTEAQRRNPIILKAAADAAGVSVDELNKAFLTQRRLNLSAGEYNKLIQKGSNLIGFERAQAMLFQSASREEFERNLSIQEKLNLAMTRVTQEFEKLVNIGFFDAVIDGFVGFATALGQGKSFYSMTGPDALDAFSDAYSATFNKKSGNTQQVEDFTLRAHPKDTLVMAGGTKFGEETNALLRELITAVNAGGDVYMSGTKVGKHIFGNLTKQS